MTDTPPTPPPARPERGFDGEARLSYGSYLKVPELLALQVCQSKPAHHDELQFIVVHQTYELWFRLVLFELEAVRTALEEDRLESAIDGLRRVHEIEKVLVQQVHVLETMTPAGFLGFRDHLRPASGFQSVQFREVEVLSGLREPAFLEFLKAEGGADVSAAVDRRLAEPSLREALHALLVRRGLCIGFDAPSGHWSDELLRERLLPIYLDCQPRDLYEVLEGLVQHDESILLWRHHHVAMVERLIGSRVGTGGSSGAAYLRATTQRRFFPELWAVRGALGAEPY